MEALHPIFARLLESLSAQPAQANFYTTCPAPRLDVLTAAPIYAARCGMRPIYPTMWGAAEYERGYHLWPTQPGDDQPEAWDGYLRRDKEELQAQELREEEALDRMEREQ